MPQRILDIISEYPQKEHVAAKAPDIGVQERICHIGQRFRHIHKRRSRLTVAQHDRSISKTVGVGLQMGLTAKTGRRKCKDVERDQPERDILALNVLKTVGIVKRNEHRRVVTDRHSGKSRDDNSP